MNKLELLTALETMTVAEQLEVLEATSKMIRDSLIQNVQKQTDLEIAAEKMQPLYAEGLGLTAFTDQNPEDFYEYSEYA
jgi:hypothetical protein